MVVASLSLVAVLGVTIDRLVYFEDNFINLTYINDSMDQPAPHVLCTSWVCTNDSIYAIMILVNIGEYI